MGATVRFTEVDLRVRDLEEDFFLEVPEALFFFFDAVAPFFDEEVLFLEAPADDLAVFLFFFEVAVFEVLALTFAACAA